MGKILFVNRGSGFMTDALKANLEKAGFTTVSVEPDVESIEAGKEEIDLIVNILMKWIKIEISV